MNCVHWRENQTSIQGFPQVLSTWGGTGGEGGGALQNLIGEGGGGGASKKRENILLISVLWRVS